MHPYYSSGVFCILIKSHYNGAHSIIANDSRTQIANRIYNLIKKFN